MIIDGSFLLLVAPDAHGGIAHGVVTLSLHLCRVKGVVFPSMRATHDIEVLVAPPFNSVHHSITGVRNTTKLSVSSHDCSVVFFPVRPNHDNGFFGVVLFVVIVVIDIIFVLPSSLSL